MAAMNGRPFHPDPAAPGGRHERHEDRRQRSAACPPLLLKNGDASPSAADRHPTNHLEESP
jgi:hypothetical protein